MWIVQHENHHSVSIFSLCFLSYIACFFHVFCNYSNSAPLHNSIINMCFSKTKLPRDVGALQTEWGQLTRSVKSRSSFSTTRPCTHGSLHASNIPPLTTRWRLAAFIWGMCLPFDPRFRSEWDPGLRGNLSMPFSIRISRNRLEGVLEGGGANNRKTIPKQYL